MTTKLKTEEGTAAPENVIGTVPAAVREAGANNPASSEPGPATARQVQGLSDAPPITARRRKPSTARRWRKRGILLLLLVLAGSAAAWNWKPLSEKIRQYTGAKTASAGVGNIQVFSVKRGDLRMTMVEEGKLRAVNNYPIRLGSSGKITWLAEAGAKVKKGDKLVTLDTQSYETQIRSFQTDLDTMQNQLGLAEKQLPIAKDNGIAAKATAQTLLDNAELALKQYTTLDVRKKLSDLDTASSDARSKLADQQKKRADLQTQLDEILDEGSAKDKVIADLDVAKQTEASLKRAVTTAEQQRILYRSYTYPQELKTKQRAVENAKLDLKKAETNAENEYQSKQGEIQRVTASIARTKLNITQYEQRIAKATATAPADGLIYYGSPDNDRYGISADAIKVGADWYYDGPIMTIPDLSAFQVAVPIAEVYRGRVTVGVPATVIIDAVPGLILDGKLSSVSSVSRPKVQYDSSSPSVYDAVLDLPVADQRMVAGMTVRVELVTGVLSDVLYAPVEAVFNEEGKTAVFMSVAPDGHVEKRPVLTGQSNDHFVELMKGVHEGDKLLLSRPATAITPRDYREQAEAMAPPPATRATAPASAPGTASRSVSSTAPRSVPSTTPASFPATTPAFVPSTAPATVPATTPVSVPASGPATRISPPM
jgi:HlyD family secretion protein